MVGMHDFLVGHGRIEGWGCIGDHGQLCETKQSQPRKACKISEDEQFRLLTRSINSYKGNPFYKLGINSADNIRG